MPNANSEKEGRNNRKIYENLVKKSAYDRWVFENYTKERLKALGVIS